MQTYETHVHRPTATGVGYLFVLCSLIAFAMRWFGVGGRLSMAAGIGGILGALIVLLGISRTYITRLQDRIIKLEMRVRGASLLSADSSASSFSSTTRGLPRCASPPMPSCRPWSNAR
jgi:hypothetical protein